MVAEQRFFLCWVVLTLRAVPAPTRPSGVYAGNDPFPSQGIPPKFPLSYSTYRETYALWYAPWHRSTAA